MLFLLIGLLLVVGYAISVVFEVTIEEGLLLSIIGTIIILLVFGCLNILSFGFYLTIVLSVLLVLYCIYKLTTSKSFTIYKIVTPGISVFLIVNILYFSNVKNLGFHNWDEASHWGVSIVHMLKSGTLYHGLQTLGLPMFSYYVTRILGYSESIVFMTRWIFLWSLLILLMKSIKWDKWFIAVIGALLSLCAISLVAVEPIYYMDTPLGVFGGVIMAHKVLDRKRYITKDVIIYSSIILLPHIKDGTGFEVAILVTLFYVVDELLIKQRKWLTTGIKGVLLVGGSILSYRLSQFTKADLPDYFDIDRLPNWDSFIAQLVNKEAFVLYIIFALALATLVVTYKVAKIARSKYQKLYWYTSIAVMTVTFILILKKALFSLYLAFDDMGKGYLKAALYRMLERNYYNKPTYILIVLIVILTIVLVTLFLHAKERKRYIVHNGLMVLFIVLHGLLLSLSYATAFADWESKSLMCYGRYFGFIIIAVSIFIISGVLYRQDLFVSQKQKILIASVLALLFINALPVPIHGMFRSQNNYYIANEHGMKQYAKKAADDINEIVESDARMFIVSQNNSTAWTDSGVVNWIHYYIAPREVNFINYSFGNKYFDEDVRTADIEPQTLKSDVENYDYLYIDNADQTFYSRYGEMLDVIPNMDRAIYKVNPNAIILVWQAKSVR